MKPLRSATEALRRHIYLEEEFAFPPLNTGGRAIALMVMYKEHGEIWRAMDRLDEILDSKKGDPVAECQHMLEILEKHNEKEEPVIYPHLDSELSPEMQNKLQIFIESGSMPAGWTCRDA